MATYHTIKNQPKPTARRTWFGLLNAIFAMALTTEIDSDIAVNERLDKAEIFYERGVGLCGNQILRGTSIEIGVFGPTDLIPT